MYAGYQKNLFKVKSETLTDTSKNKDMTNQTMGYLIMFMLFSAANLSGYILKKKRNRTYFRLLTTPIDGKKFILSNVGVNMMILTIQILITILFLTNVFSYEYQYAFHSDDWRTNAICFNSDWNIISSCCFFENSASANTMQNLVIVPTCLLAGCYFPYDIMPKAVQKSS